MKIQKMGQLLAQHVPIHILDPIVKSIQHVTKFHTALSRRYALFNEIMSLLLKGMMVNGSEGGDYIERLHRYGWTLFLLARGWSYLCQYQ